MQEETSSKRNIFITYFFVFITLVIVILLFYRYDIKLNIGAEEHEASEEHELSESAEEDITEWLAEIEELESLDKEAERIESVVEAEESGEREEQLKEFLFENLSNRTFE